LHALHFLFASALKLCDGSFATQYGAKLMQNYFPTLNAALDSESLIDIWPITASVPYGATVALANAGRWISIYRDGVTGLYERPVHYATLMSDTDIIHL
jgi:hypothetical protein